MKKHIWILKLILFIPVSLYCSQADSTLHISENKKSFSNIITLPPFIKVTAQSQTSKNTEANNTQSKLMPIRCFVTESEQGKAVAHKPVVKEELTGKTIEVNEIKYGHYEFVIEKEKKYFIECNVVGYKNFEQSVDISSAVIGELNTMEIVVVPYRENENFILKNIYFHPNTPVFKTQSSGELAQLYSYMKNNPTVVISIEGHTNSNRYIGKDKQREQIGGKWAFHGTAKKLSKERANEVKIFLTKNGISEERIKIKGWGGRKELYPDARNLSESMKNMRVEIHILKM